MLILLNYKCYYKIEQRIYKKGNEMKKYAFGVDIGGTTCKIGFFKTTGILLDKWEIDTDIENGGINILPDVAKAIDNRLERESISKNEVQGIGVGGGIIVDGKIVAGFNGAGGEIGHITVNHDEIEACNCGQYGCLEQYVSATGIVRVAKRKLAKTEEETSLKKFEPLTAKDVFDEAKAGDDIAVRLVDEICEILGLALSNMACVVNPEIAQPP